MRPVPAMADCPDCGARYGDGGDSCARRFDELLALDHSHVEPWGSRHALAFGVYALQHPGAHNDSTRALARELLRRVYDEREPLARVVADFRARSISRTTPVDEADVPPRGGPFDVTIADLGAFDAESYPAALDRWATATLERVR